MIHRQIYRPSMLAIITLVPVIVAAMPHQGTPFQTELFEKKVRPILMDKCVECHGPDKQMAGLRLDSAEGLSHGASGKAVVVGSQPEQSRLIRAIRYDGEKRMPPSGKLSPIEISTLTDWVKQGAIWPKTVAATSDAGAKRATASFWSFQPVKRVTPPAVQTAAWVKTPIDSFVLSGLEKRNLKAAPRADKQTLLRRAYHDLIGLPPSQEESTQFLGDKSPHAYEALVDRLLARPEFGERWARHWLDLVRYCDSLDSRSIGSPGDIAEAYRYRDWVVRAFNKDMPYSEFVRDQIAGDVLTGKSKQDYDRDKVIATSVLSIGNWGNGDADKDKIYTDIVDDQVDLISRTFMGLTVACARCHNHKFDPITAKDYYGLAGIFFSTHILAKFTPKGAGEDVMRVPLLSAEEVREREETNKKIAALKVDLDRETNAVNLKTVQLLKARSAEYLLAAWEAGKAGADPVTSVDRIASARGLAPFAVRQWVDALGLGALNLMKTPVTDLLGSPGVYAFKGAADTPSLSVNTTPDTRMLLTFTLTPHSVSIHPGPNTGVAIAWKSPITGTVSCTGTLTDADPACGDGITWNLKRGSGAAGQILASGEFDNGGRQSLPPNLTFEVKKGDFLTYAVLPRNGHACDTTRVDWRITAPDGKVWDVAKELTKDPIGGGNPRSDSFGNAATWWYIDLGGASRARFADAAGAAVLSEWRSAMMGGNADLKAAASQKLVALVPDGDPQNPFRPNGDSDAASVTAINRSEIARISSNIAALNQKVGGMVEQANAALEGGIPLTPYEGFHDARIHIRGNYARLGDVAPRGFPAVLQTSSPPKITTGSGRKELADWITDPRHPLTSRVMVNRIWQHLMGDGIVRTPSNFGFLGERPTNPALLDWLADRFVRDGWSMKKLIRLIMTSSVYQQSPESDPATRMADPDNRLFGRQSRRRLEAESLRDSLLFVSGALDKTIGGPSVKNFSEPRRGIYVMSVRSDRTGFGPLFDSADTTGLVDKRTVSIVAPQSLYMMNSEFVRAQARLLAILAIKSVPESVPERIQWLYGRLFSRIATAREIAVGQRLIKGLATPATNSPVDAGKADPPREWETYCQTLLCSNEFIFVD